MRSILGRGRGMLVLALMLALPAAWGKGIDDFKLIKAIPADAAMAVNCRDHAGKEFINKQYERIWEAVRAAHFERDLKNLLKAGWQQDQPPDASSEEFDAWWQQMYDLCTSVEWGSLGKREFALGMKLGVFSPVASPVELVVLMMPPEDKVKDSFEGLAGILKTVADLDPNSLKLAAEENEGTLIRRLSFPDAPFAVGLTVARHNDVIVVGLGSTMIEQTLALLRGEAGESLAATTRFKAAFADLPPPADQLAFFDMGKFFGQVRELIAVAVEMAQAAAPPEGEPGHEEFVQQTSLPGKILDALDMWEYMATVKTTDGMLATTDTLTVLRAAAQSCALYPVLYGNGPLKDPLKYVPENAGDFWVTSGIDVPALYQFVIKFIREEAPDGEDMIAQLEALQTGPEGEPGWNIEQDIVSWIGGGMCTFSVPGKTPYSSSEFVMMLSVRDEAKARALLDRLYGLAGPLLANQNGSIVDAEIEGAEGFKSVILPMLAMMGMSKPTLGVNDGWLFFGSSPEMIRSAMDVGSGKAANFSTNERFKKEGIPPEGRVTSLSFTDQTKMGEQIGQVLSMVPMIGMMVPDMARNPGAQAVLSVVGKLGRVVKKLDFFQSSASRTTFDGKAERVKALTTYREPPVITKPKPTKVEESEAEPSEE